MKSFDEALNYLLEKAQLTQKTEIINIENGLEKILSKGIVSSVNVPPHNNSMMDGYGLNSQDFKPGKTYQISQRIVAGELGKELKKDTVVRIFTGAAIPKGVDMVIMQEEAEVEGEKVKLNSETTRPGQNIRTLGEDIALGNEILSQGHILRPQDLGLIASIGTAKVEVYQPLTIATFTTGDELLEPGDKAEEGKIYNANRYFLTSAITQLGFKLIDLGQIKDTLEATIEAMQQASKLGDVVITTGGVSVGEEDHIKPAMTQLGSLDMWQVKMKPGKPLAYGDISGTPFIGLPGNPVSAFTTFNLFARPFLLSMQGASEVHARPLWFEAKFDWLKAGFRKEFARARLVNENQKTLVEIYSNQGSGVLTSTVWADGLVVIPENILIKKGDKVAFYPFNPNF